VFLCCGWREVEEESVTGGYELIESVNWGWSD
jgi:hypothetical protein